MNAEDEQTDSLALRAEIRRLREQLELEQKRFRKLETSTSWRITAPLRALVTWYRRGATVKALAPSSAIGPTPAFIPYPLRSICEAVSGNPHASLRRIDAEDAMRPLLGSKSSVDFTPETQARIAAIASAELVSELNWDADVLALAEKHWKEQLQPGRFDYLLLEPVWHVDSREWCYVMAAGSDRQQAIVEVIGHCHRIGLPVVLWFREDIGNYSHFSWLADLADRTYALDAIMQGRLAADFPHKKIDILPLAVQPRMHNPLRSVALQSSAPAFSGKVLVDGWWEMVDKGVATQLAEFGEDLRVCESDWDFSRAHLAESSSLVQSTLGCIRQVDKAALAKLFSAEIFLQSALRLPWRRRMEMLRSAAAGCIPLALGAEDEVPAWPAVAAGSGPSLRRIFQSLQADHLRRASLAHRLAADIVQGHVLAERLDTISMDLGLARGRKASPPRVAAILVTMRPQFVPECIERFRRELHSNKELQIVLHGNADARAVRSLIRPGEPIHVHEFGRERSLGACLNYAIHQTNAPYWAKFDDDDIYGPRYLAEIMDARRWGEYSLYGKPPAFTYFEGEKALYWEPDWGDEANRAYSSNDPHRVAIAGATLVGRRELVEAVQFSEKRRGGSDSDFILRSLEAGNDVVALDPFGFARFRSASDNFHTHRFDHAELARRAIRVGGAESVVKLIDP